MLDVIQATDPAYAHMRAQRQRAEREAQQRAELEEASGRARELLVNHLSDEQRQQFEANPIACTQSVSATYAQQGGPSFQARGSEGGRYCIHMGRAHNVFAIDENGQHTFCYCAHIRDNVPNEDNVLAQKLMIEAHEDQWLGLAAVSRVR